MTERAAPGAGQRGQRLTYLVKRLEMAERARMDEVLRPLGVTLHQYTALSILESREGLSAPLRPLGGPRRQYPPLRGLEPGQRLSPAQAPRRPVLPPQAMHQLIAPMER